MTIRAKFVFVGREIAYAGQQKLKFTPQYDTSIPEDKRFYDATPSGEFTMLCNNPDVLGALTLGDAYYFDITPAPKA